MWLLNPTPSRLSTPAGESGESGAEGRRADARRVDPLGRQERPEPDQPGREGGRECVVAGERLVLEPEAKYRRAVLIEMCMTDMMSGGTVVARATTFL